MTRIVFLVVSAQDNSALFIFANILDGTGVQQCAK